jgi:predicted DNA-binding ribbon-helix-helix protein
MQHRNLTLKLDADLYKEVKVIAAQRDTSISALVSDKLSELVEQENGYAKARVHALALLEQGFALGTKAEVAWSRDALHER